MNVDGLPVQEIVHVGGELPLSLPHLKQQGVKRGVPDLCLPVARGNYHALYIELKTDTGRATTEQKWWGEHLKCQGNMWQVCHGWEAAVTMLEWYLSLSDEVVT